MDTFFIASGLILLLLVVPLFYRVFTGPTVIDRLVGVNLIGTKTTVLIIIIGTLFERVEMFVDIALTYAMLNFIVSLAAAKYFQRHSSLTSEQRGTTEPAGESS